MVCDDDDAGTTARLSDVDSQHQCSTTTAGHGDIVTPSSPVSTRINTTAVLHCNNTHCYQDQRLDATERCNTGHNCTAHIDMQRMY